MAFISSLLKPAKHEKTKTKKGEGEHQEVLKKKEHEKKEKGKLHEHEEDSSEESESYSEEDSSDEENEQDRENEHLNESNKTWNSENNDEDEDDDEEEDRTVENIRKEEVHKIYTSEDDDDVSRRNSAHSNNEEYTKKKTKLSFNKKKVQSYFHKSYDKVSNAIIKTSKSFFKPHHHGDLKNVKEQNVNDSNHILHCLENIEQDRTGDDSDFSNEDCRNIIKYLDKHINCEEKNEEIIKNFTTLLENNDPKKVLEELQIILDERTLLLKSLNYFKILSINYKKQLNKSNNSYDILKSENEQLTENVKMLKKFIVSLDMNNVTSSEVDQRELKQDTCEFLKEPEKEQKEEHTHEEHIESDHNEDNGGSTERNKGEYGSEALEPTSKDEENMKLNIIDEHDLNIDENMYREVDNDNKKEKENKNEDKDRDGDENKNKNEKKSSFINLKIEEQETLINNADVIIRKEVVEETTT